MLCAVCRYIVQSDMRNSGQRLCCKPKGGFGIRIAHAASWQLEFTRLHEPETQHCHVDALTGIDAAYLCATRVLTNSNLKR